VKRNELRALSREINCLVYRKRLVKKKHPNLLQGEGKVLPDILHQRKGEDFFLLCLGGEVHDHKRGEKGS